MSGNCRFAMNLVLSMFIAFFVLIDASLAVDEHPGKIRVALYLDSGAHPPPDLVEALDNQKDFKMTEVDGDEVRDGYLKDFDVLLVPGGSGKVEASSLGEEGRDEIRRFVGQGGLYLGICAGSYLATDARPQYLCILPISILDRPHWRRGRATLPIELTASGKDVFGIEQPTVQIVYHNGPIFGTSHGAEAEIKPLAFFRDEIVAPGGRPGLMNGAPAAVWAKCGKGRIICVSPHAERTPGLENVIPNAVRWLYAHRNQDTGAPKRIKSGSIFKMQDTTSSRQ